MIRRILAAAVATVAALTLTTPAHAADPPLPRLSSHVVCVQPDFPVTGSGWKVHAAIGAWNAAQGAIRFTTILEPGCALVRVHRYTSTTDGWCGYTSWYESTLYIDGAGLTATDVDVYLNTVCAVEGPGQTRRIVAHELGHAVGLSHNHLARSVMSVNVWYPLRVATMIRPVDARAVSALYPA